MVDRSVRNGLVLVPKNRTQFPGLIDFVLRAGKWTYRVPGSRDLRLDAAELVIRSEADDSPMSLFGQAAGFETERLGTERTFYMTCLHSTFLTLAGRRGYGCGER